MKGLALATIGLWVILQTTFGPLSTKLGLITGAASSSTSPPSAGSEPGASPGGLLPFLATAPSASSTGTPTT